MRIGEPVVARTKVEVHVICGYEFTRDLGMKGYVLKDFTDMYIIIIKCNAVIAVLKIKDRT